MTIQLVPEDLLAKADKILFVAHLALGDFTYMQNSFRAFSRAYPHIKIHLWIDELRRTPDQSQWEHLRKYSLYDWVNSCDMFAKVYTETYNPPLFEQSIKEAQAEAYPIVVSLAVHNRHRYVNLIRNISKDGFIVGQKKRVRFLDIRKHYIYSKLNAFIPAYKVTREQQAGKLDIPHISRIYAGWFHQLFNLDIPTADLFPFVTIPQQWHDDASQQIANWGFSADEKIVFLNSFSKSRDRTWSLERIFELIIKMKKLEKWSGVKFVVNVVPEKLPEAQAMHAQYQLGGVQLFSAVENFFQLPALLSRCHLIISVETAVMHLANAVNVPVIALMRLTSPEWVPINAEITTLVKVSNRKAWIDDISVDQVVAALP